MNLLFMSLRNISPRSLPKNFDPRNELVVANEQFARVLSAQGLLPTDARLRELLTRRYAVSDFRRQTTVHQVQYSSRVTITYPHRVFWRSKWSQRGMGSWVLGWGREAGSIKHLGLQGNAIVSLLSS